jgi:hypothetical protein
MALFWVEVGNMPPNGTCALLHCATLDLPSTHNEASRRFIFDNLQQQHLRQLSLVEQRSLLDWAENVAVMNYALSEYMDASISIGSMDSFLAQFTADKLMTEVRNTVVATALAFCSSAQNKINDSWSQGKIYLFLERQEVLLGPRLICCMMFTQMRS